MKLELDVLNISDVQFGKRTEIRGGILHIDRQEIQELLAQDQRFGKVDVELVHPGDDCRIVQVFDVVEPRAKTGETGENFPGILGKLKTAGEGRTRVLRGTTVVIIDYTLGLRGLVIEMTGPAADMGIYARLQNVVLLCQPAPGIQRNDYQNALRVAGLKAAVYLAQASPEIEPDKREVYSLGSPVEVGKGIEHLPRVAYIFQIHSLQQGIVPNEPIFYGDNVSKLLPTLVHPNEILDGALVRNFWTRGHETYSIQNHPIILELYQKHGRELCFVGVVATIAHADDAGRERSANMSAKLAKYALSADGVIITKTGGGAPNIDLAQTCVACEQLGVKTTIVTQDQSHDGSSDGALIFDTPLADAIVNVGCYSRPIVLPAVKRVIGGPVTFEGGRPADGEIEVVFHLLCGVMNQIGISRVTVSEI